MSTLISGFEYDIFISYRHNDNRSGWVTEFVNALQEELASTIKEPLSIYFDKNPHDGLLETHNVNDSLKDKLRCLIFVPVISRTYCDPKSFAWNYEFVAFLKTAAVDAHGLKVRLPNGNTGSRVLPIRIHELDANDKRIIESELQGPLRAIDFTFQTAGVNRPLRSKEDETQKLTVQNSYRDQINKTANAISDIIAGLQGKEHSAIATDTANKTTQTTTQHYEPKPTARKFRLLAFDKITGLTLALIVALLSFVALAASHFSEKEPESKTYKFTIPPTEKTIYSTDLGGHVSLSSNGNYVSFVAFDSVGNTRLWIRALNSVTAEVLKGTEGAAFPFWSPDSRFIGFFADGKLKKIAVSGGPAQTLCTAIAGRGGSWGKEGTIIFGDNTRAPISRVPETGGRPEAITKLDTARNEVSHRWPCFMPDGRHFLYTNRLNLSGLSAEDAVFLASLDTTEMPRMIVKASSNFEYANGHLLFAQQTTLMAKPFNTEDFTSSGDAFPVAEKIYFDGFTSRATFSVSQNGVLVYQTGASASRTRLHWRDRSGKLVGTVGNDAPQYISSRLSPDGERLVTSLPDSNGQLDLWLFDTKRLVWTRFTFDKGTDRFPVWSPDGKTIAFSSDRNKHSNIYQRSSNGEGAEELLLKSNLEKFPTDWSRDGKFLALNAFDPKGAFSNDIWILPMTPKGSSDRKPFAFLQTEFSETRAAFSPDGRWIAYQSDESGRDEVYIRPFPGPGGKWQVSTGGGTRPRWRGDGKELFYMTGSNMTGNNFRLMSVNVRLGSSTVEVSSAQPLFENRITSAGGKDLYDVTQDGKLFLVENSMGGGGQAPLTMVINWPGEIKMK